MRNADSVDKPSRVLCRCTPQHTGSCTGSRAKWLLASVSSKGPRFLMRGVPRSDAFRWALQAGHVAWRAQQREGRSAARSQARGRAGSGSGNCPTISSLRYQGRSADWRRHEAPPASPPNGNLLRIWHIRGAPGLVERDRGESVRHRGGAVGIVCDARSRW